MTRTDRQNYSPIARRCLSGTLLSLLLLTISIRALGHGGHGNEFQGGNQAAQSSEAIQVDSETAKRLGLKVEPVKRQRLAFGVQTTGQIEALPSQKVEVTNATGGTVVRLYVQPGDAVEAGQPVALLTSPELAGLRTSALEKQSEAQGNVKQAQAELQLAQENYAQQQKLAEADLQQAKIALSFAQERYDKDKELLARGAIPRRQVLESETKLAEARAALAKVASRLPVAEATAQLKRAQSAAEVAQDRVELSSTAYTTRLTQLGATANPDGTITVTAPISGVVADREITLGQSAQDAGARLMTIVNGQTVIATANVYEKDLAQVSKGQRVKVTVAALPNRVFNGRISVVGATVEGETRVLPVKAELDNAGGSLKPGMFVTLEVLTDSTATAVLAVPKSALVETNDKKQVVFVQNGTGYQAAEVDLGRQSGDWVEVKRGLFDGDLVVTQRANQLYAQSLRGGTKAGADEHGKAEAATTPQTAGLLPGWMVFPVGGAIAVGTFWAGTFWATRRSRQLAMQPTLNGHSSSDYEKAEFDPNRTDQSEESYSSTRSKE
jgi:membrane fusion protein, heavy metal efflux system